MYSEIQRRNFVPEKLYAQFLRNLPLCCVDVVVVYGGVFLLVKRKNIPAGGKWWLPGGRLLWREHPERAAKRKLREELGIRKVDAIKFIGFGESRFNKGYFGNPYHSINLTFVARVGAREARRIRLDMVHHTEYKWFRRIVPTIPSYVAKFLSAAGFKK